MECGTTLKTILDIIVEWKEISSTSQQTH